MKVLFFSPRGTTKQTARTIARSWEQREERDLLGSPLTQDLTLPAQEPVLVALPVYAGRIPTPCRDMLRDHLKGSGGPAIAVAVYGNRAYDDALLELADLLGDCGFQVVAAGAFIGRHSIFTKVAAGRPDQADAAAMSAFGQACRDKLDRGDQSRPDIPGDPGYRAGEMKRVPFHPDCNDRCMKCYACFHACPTGAIPEAAPWETGGDKCVSCGACIFLCPTQARQYRGIAYETAAAGFGLKCARRQEPEVFL